VGHAIKCLAYTHAGIEDLRGTPIVLECGSNVTTCNKMISVQNHTASSMTFKFNVSFTVYSGFCGGCSSSLPSGFTCTTCNTDQCNSAFAAVLTAPCNSDFASVRAAALLTLALPLLMAAALRSF
uniref:UPAR/Ly6 domain-containing protein n=1 Tax=Macrostomum lignano TaxID=282301 RepID=A0A1I8GDH4_9PLAT